MTKYYGLIDLDNLPPRILMETWEREAKRLLRLEDSLICLERRIMDYVWNKVAEYDPRNINLMKGGEVNGI